jgi:hypothetical protein
MLARLQILEDYRLILIRLDRCLFLQLIGVKPQMNMSLSGLGILR